MHTLDINNGEMVPSQNDAKKTNENPVCVF